MTGAPWPGPVALLRPGLLRVLIRLSAGLRCSRSGTSGHVARPLGTNDPDRDHISLAPRRPVHPYDPSGSAWSGM